jgi:hypothetical protein
MDKQRQGMFTPALVGGAVAGILSAVPFVNCLCCLWIIGGAMLASYLLSKNSLVSLTAGDGAIVGIFAGIVAAVAHSLVSLPLQDFNRRWLQVFMEQFSQFTEEMPAGWDKLLEQQTGGTSLPLFLLSLVILAAIYSVLGALGGIIGASLFGRKKPPQAAEIKDETRQDPGYRQP